MHRVFVYGTLRRGGINHGLLAGAERLGAAVTPPVYTLLDFGWYPGLIEGGDTAVRGEVYAVDDETLAKLDELEEHPEVYVRQKISLPPYVEVQAYIMRNKHAQGGRVVPSGDWPPEGP